MRVFILSAIAAVILALAGFYGLNAMQQSIASAYISDSVRLDQQEAVDRLGRQG